jgi:hypothetical protein
MTSDPAAADGLPLSALLSQALVAFTIEFDNEAERQIQHSTTNHGRTPGGVWLVSMAMWLNCMRHLGEDPICAGELRRLARGGTNLAGMQRWGYITVDRDPADHRAKPPDADLLVRATGKGLRAKEVWQPLTAVIEQRWRDRYGAGTVGGLHQALAAVAGQLGSGLPDCLPILGYGLFSAGSKPGENRYRAAQDSPAPDGVADLPLPWLLARVLLALAIDFEQESSVSLSITANVLQLLDEQGIRVRDLPTASGVSAEGLAMATGYLERRGLAVVAAGTGGSKWKVARLTRKGSQARDTSLQLLTAVEDRWHARYGSEVIVALRQALEPLAGEPLLAATQPFPSGWRASVRRPAILPQYPMVLHRGGYPDGS